MSKRLQWPQKEETPLGSCFSESSAGDQLLVAVGPTCLLRALWAEVGDFRARELPLPTKPARHTHSLLPIVHHPRPSPSRVTQKTDYVPSVRRQFAVNAASSSTKLRYGRSSGDSRRGPMRRFRVSEIHPPAVTPRVVNHQPAADYGSEPDDVGGRNFAAVCHSTSCPEFELVLGSGNDFLPPRQIHASGMMHDAVPCRPRIKTTKYFPLGSLMAARRAAPVVQ